MTASNAAQVPVEARVAAKWWADKLRAPANRMDAGADSPEMAFAEVITSAIGARENRGRLADEADRFEAAVAAYVAERLEQSKYGATLSTDYGSLDYELVECARTAQVNLSMASLPCKTVMWVKRGSVRVSEGYGATPVDLSLR